MRYIVFALFVLCPLSATAQGVGELQKAFNAAASKAGPAVVSVQVIKEETQAVLEPDYYFGHVIPSEKLYRYKSAGMGSGVIIDPRGYVLTNLHVVQDALRIKVVTQDAKGVEKSWVASVAGNDPALDLALLKIRGGASFPWLGLNGVSSLQIGDFVLAVGYPFGFKQTVTSGIISALNASMPVEGRKYEKLIQTDAAINHGNSGGPLLNLKGEVIGINTAIASPTGVFAGMGFAVPSSEINKVLGDLIAGRKIRRGWLGVSLLHLDSLMAKRLGLALPEGAIVNVSVEGSPAYKAGIRRGDIILACDGTTIETNEDLFYQTYSRRPGDEVEIVYLRRGVRKTIKIKLGERGMPGDHAVDPGPVRGNPQAGAKFVWEGVGFSYSGGARVVSIAKESRLDGYLRPGDTIQAVNGAEVKTPALMTEVFRSANLADGVVFDLLRDGESTYLSVQSR
ncbi:MAG: hypothetical protein A2234_10245 [Elusimicrobia bacterium RIFOXYA2_FULL_58_8]|nr:MAG: hypothetical protein A2234_10245 [Elusimicrobia bacterium RIFOXYA2_FULL_58_8]